MTTLNIPNTFTAGNTIVASQMNANFNAVKAVINGNIDSTNIANGAVGATQLDSAVSPATFLYSAFGQVSFVGNGCLLSDTSSGDTAQITVSAGVIYTVSSSTLVKYVKSSDTYNFSSDGDYYLFISSSGVLSADGGITPSAGTQLLAKCVVSGTAEDVPNAAVAITDYARRGAFRPKELEGLELSYNDGNTLDVYAGFAKIAGVDYKLPANLSVELQTDANWIGGSAEYAGTPGSPVSQWVYVYVTGTDTWLSVKLSTTAPAYFDEYGQTVTSYFPNKWHYASATPYRCIGAVYTTDNGSSFTAMREFRQCKNEIYYDAGVQVSASTTASANIPAISRVAILRLWGRASSGANVDISVAPAGSSSVFLNVTTSGANTQGIVFYECPTNSSQQVNFTDAGTGDIHTCYTYGYIMAIRD